MAFPFERWKKKKKLRTTSLKKAPEKKEKKEVQKPQARDGSSQRRTRP